MPAAKALSPPRRSTRVTSLAHFRYHGGKEKEEGVSTEIKLTKSGSEDDVSSLSELSFGSDIEDAIVEPKRRGGAASKTKLVYVKPMAIKNAAGATGTGKRKRTATMTATTTSMHIFPDRKKQAAAVQDLGGTNPTQAEQQMEGDTTKANEMLPAADKNTELTAAPPTRRSRRPARVVAPAKAKAKSKGGQDDNSCRIAEGLGVEPPTDWEEMYRLVKEMRLPGGPAAEAAVDTMGCERLAQKGASARDRRFHTLVALMLSSQTKDTVNAVVMARLQTELPAHKPGAPAGLNLENMLAVEPALLNQMIWQVGFHNNKTRYLKQAAEILRDQWDGDIPPTAEGLMALPGVGPKMAYLCLSAENGWNRVEGIGVDVHVHRITNLWGWQRPGSAQAKTPESTRLALQSWLPHDRWKEINWLLVGFGQKVCLPQGAKCGECTLGLRGLCRAANRKKVADGRRRLQQKQEEGLGVNGDAAVKEENNSD